MSPQIEIAKRALVGEVVHIRLTAFLPNSQIKLQADLVDEMQQAWTSWAMFETDLTGTVNVGTQQPLAGTYATIDAMGLFWSMSRVQPAPEGIPPQYLKLGFAPSHYTFTAEVAGQPVAKAEFDYIFMTDEVIQQNIREESLVGQYFRPASSDPHPALLCITGSSGGFYWSETMAALLASYGYAVLTLAYFDYHGMEELPTGLIEIPLEYFERGLQWLASQPEVDAERIGVTGISKGGELALLLASTFPIIKTVVAFVPSVIAYEGFQIGPPTGHRSSWAYKGQPIPFAPYPDEQAFPTMDVDRSTMRAMHAAPLTDPTIITNTLFALENINGPILLLSGTADMIWPSAELSDIGVAYLKEHGFAHEVNHLRYEDVGHIHFIPHMPIMETSVLAGGTNCANAQAEAESWPRILAFLSANL